MSRTVRVGSRDSALAVVQTQLIIETIGRHHPDLKFELVTMKTTGDKILDRTLDKIGGKGLFVKELDEALLNGQVDITVHSCKDLPMELPEGLPLLAFSQRGDPRDVLVLPEGTTELNPALPIGCSSSRRSLYLSKCYPHMAVAPVRGNLQTRLKKLDDGQYSALVLASAGLKRMGLEHRISQYFDTATMIPAAGQGILAVQGRLGENHDFLACVNHRESALCAMAERAFTRRLDGGCSSPVAAFATVEGETITVRGMYLTPDNQSIEEQISGNCHEGESLATALADQLKEGCL